MNLRWIINGSTVDLHIQLRQLEIVTLRSSIAIKLLSPIQNVRSIVSMHFHPLSPIPSSSTRKERGLQADSSCEYIRRYGH